MPAHPSSFIAERRGQGGDGDGQGRIELWHVLSVVPDPRAARGIRHPLSTVLTLAVAAVAAGARSLTGISAWASDLPVVHRSRFGVGRAVPSAATFARELAGVDADVLDAVLCAWLGARTGPRGGLAPLAVLPSTASGGRQDRPWRPPRRRVAGAPVRRRDPRRQAGRPGHRTGEGLRDRRVRHPAGPC